MRGVFALLLLLPVVLCHNEAAPVVTQELVDHINSLKTTWTASIHQGKLSKMTVGQASKMMGVLQGGPVLEHKTYLEAQQLPDNFDSAVHWPNCKTINNIRDQSDCGSCWAFAAVEAMSDRYCTILGDAKYSNIMVSDADMLACCSTCGMGCSGGYPSAAWEYWVKQGLADESCDPYPFPKCDHHTHGKYPDCPSDEYPTPKCNHTCADGSAKKKYLKGTSSYGVSGEPHMMQEIFKNGPIEVAFTVYQDFLTYKSGVYQHTTGSALGGHAVKATGWGVTADGVKYWIINNSWNEDWGNNGQFLIIRGTNECGIEGQGVAGVPAAF